MKLKYHGLKINVLGQIVTVTRERGLIEQGIKGLYKYAEKSIVIDATLKGIDLDHTLMHEVAHALMYRSSVYQSLAPALEEVIVDTLATLLVENFALVPLKKRK